MPFQTEDLAVTIRPSGLYRLTQPLVYTGRDQTFVGVVTLLALLVGAAAEAVAKLVTA